MSRPREASPYAFTVPPLVEAVSAARAIVADRARQIGLDLALLRRGIASHAAEMLRAAPVPPFFLGRGSGRDGRQDTGQGTGLGGAARFQTVGAGEEGRKARRSSGGHGTTATLVVSKLLMTVVFLIGVDGMAALSDAMAGIGPSLTASGRGSRSQLVSWPPARPTSAS